MCGRFTLTTPASGISEYFSVTLPQGLQADTWRPRYNIAPSQNISVIVQQDGQRQWKLFRWGLIPSWAKDMRIGYKMINARAETLAEKPSYRSAFKKRRCLVVADGFYEWEKVKGGKQPRYFTLNDGGLMAFGGLWEKWSGEKDPVYSCTIVTTTANDLLARYHDRMPVILDPKEYDYWLDADFEDRDRLRSFLDPYPAKEMTVRRVSQLVNNVKNDSPECIEPVTDPPE